MDSNLDEIREEAEKYLGWLKQQEEKTQQKTAVGYQVKEAEAALERAKVTTTNIEISMTSLWVHTTKSNPIDDHSSIWGYNWYMERFNLHTHHGYKYYRVHTNKSNPIDDHSSIWGYNWYKECFNLHHIMDKKYYQVKEAEAALEIAKVTTTNIKISMTSLWVHTTK